MKTFLQMTEEEQRQLISEVRLRRDKLKEESEKKRARKQRKTTKKRKKEIKFSDPTLQAIFDNSKIAKKLLGAK